MQETGDIQLRLSEGSQEIAQIWCAQWQARNCHQKLFKQQETKNWNCWSGLGTQSLTIKSASVTAEMHLRWSENATALSPEADRAITAACQAAWGQEQTCQSLLVGKRFAGQQGEVLSSWKRPHSPARSIPCHLITDNTKHIWRKSQFSCKAREDFPVQPKTQILNDPSVPRVGLDQWTSFFFLNPETHLPGSKDRCSYFAFCQGLQIHDNRIFIGLCLLHQDIMHFSSASPSAPARRDGEDFCPKLPVDKEWKIILKRLDQFMYWPQSHFSAQI